MTSRRTIGLVLLALIGTLNIAYGFDTLRVNATLDTSRKTITGEVVFRLPNLPGIETIEFQLFPNVYVSDTTPYLRRIPAISRHLKDSKKWGGMDVDSVTIADQNFTEDLKIDYTRGIVKPAANSNLGGRVVAIYFRTQIPELGDRLSYFKDEFLLDGWFPNPAILKEDGTWYSPFYGGMSELVGEYFMYDVSLTVPLNMVIAGAVPPRDSAIGSDTKQYHYNFGPAHDFAMAISPHYLVDTAVVGETVMRFYYRAFEQGAIPAAKNAAVKAFEYLEAHAGKYQYKYLSYAFADFAFSGGIEFPAFITLSSPKQSGLFSSVYRMLVTHETAHQWFYGMIGTNQIESPWMDEAVSSFFAARVLTTYWGTQANIVDFWGIKLTGNDYERLVMDLCPDKGGVTRPAYDFVDEPDYFGVVYSKGELALETFDNLLGDSLSKVFWRQYFEKYLFKHPGYEDFVKTAVEIGGKSQRKILDALLNGVGDIDYSVSAVRNRKLDSAKYEISIVVRKVGGLEIPIIGKVILANGDSSYFVWEGRLPSEEILLEESSPAISVQIDPDFKIAIDDDFLNNSLTLDTDSRPGARLTSGLLFLVESLLSFLGGM